MTLDIDMRLVRRLLIGAGAVIALLLTLLTALGTLAAAADLPLKIGVFVVLAIGLLLLALVSRVAGIIWLLLVNPLAFVVVNWSAIFDFLDGALRFVFEPASRQMNIIECGQDAGCAGLWPIIFAALFFFVVLTSFAYTTLLERRLLAFFQQRIGPNRVGPLGFLQPAADGVKLVFKEDLLPAGAYRAVYTFAPLMKVLPVLLLFGVIPIGPPIILPWFAPTLGDVWFRVPLGLADPNVGLLFLLAITSLGTYGVVLAGWASNNKYAMLGGLRASAQMVSYELSFGLTLAVPIMLAGSMGIGDIIRGQELIWEWYIFQNPLAFAILFIAVSGGDQPRPLRFAGGGAGTDPGLSDRVQRYEVRAVHDGRVSGHDRGQRPGDDYLPRRLAGWFRPGAHSADPGAAGHWRQDLPAVGPDDLGAGHPAAHPLRPADAVWLEGHAAAGPGGSGVDGAGGRAR